MRFNIIIASTHKYSDWPFHFLFFMYPFRYSPMRVTGPARFILLNLIILGEEYKLRNSSHYVFIFQPSVVSSLLG